MLTGKKVFVGLSGGVDSSVAAALLKKDGYDVVGIHLKCFNVDGCAAEDAEDACRAAEHLGIPFYAFDYEQEYKDLVVKYMVDGYKKGITPNPDVMCNKEIKFGLFYKKALEMGADFVATGHYVRLANSQKGVGYSTKSKKSLNPIGYTLLAARDKNKDQSYFLWTLKPEQLQHCLFPIGDYKKPQVRKLAEKFGLHNAAKKDSQGICFLGQVSLPDFLSRYIKPKKGDILLSPSLRLPSEALAKEGAKRGNLTENPSVIASEAKQSYEIIGTHNGAHFYTIGQRHGLDISQKPVAKSQKGDTKPYYVSAKDVKKNIVVVAEGENNPALYQKEIELADVNLFTKKLPKTVFARVRYRQPVSRATLTLNANRYTLSFAKPQKFVAPGQSAVFYDKKGVMLGGGIIQ